ncbi:hypothetical protein [Virgibacillus oceani]|uniref:Uncharacterized protein n=1 Tax=Virgibacillus oceani TaxID=1479511 RepID=A0A917M6M5_9BACI|nr:hypothetical protein [Virgibacillus oceani]GGG80746.1 hypothetical protein GCM10011398_27690 [Virgibacillus oceani]
MGEKEIYILFTDTGTLFTRLIKLYTKQSYNHVSISFCDHLNDIYSFGRLNPSNPFVGGFIQEKIDMGLFEKAVCKIYSCTVTESEFEQMRNKVRQIELKKDMYKYNLFGLFAIIFNLNLSRKNAFFCSQFVATILKEKRGLLNKSPNLIKPGDLMKLKQLRLIYQGNLSLYPVHSNEDLMKNNVALQVHA